MAITDNLTYIDYLWTKKSDDGSSIEGIRLSPLNLPTDVIYTADLPTALPNPKALAIFYQLLFGILQSSIRYQV